jgi:multiple antibiotic resistance protein
MPDLLHLFAKVFLKFFFLLAPFVVVSAFLTLTAAMDERQRRRAALRATVAITVICFTLYLAGQYLFLLAGITLDAFRIGAGALLFLSGVHMVHGTPSEAQAEDPAHDIAVVPLALPLTVGPATTGALLVMSAEPGTAAEKITSCAALLMTILVTGAIFHLGARIERLIGKLGITILGKLTGLFLASLAAQMVFTGIVNFLAQAGPR